MITYNRLMSDQVLPGEQSLRNDVRDAVAVAFHVLRGGPLPVHTTIFVDGEPLQGIQIRECGAVIVRAGRHVDGQRPAVVWPWVVVARAHSPAGGNGGVRLGG